MKGRIGCKHDKRVVHARGFRCTDCNRYFDDTTFTYKKLILGEKKEQVKEKE